MRGGGTEVYWWCVCGGSERVRYRGILVVCMWGQWEGEVQRYTGGVYVGAVGGRGTEVYWWCGCGGSERVRYRGILVVCM